MDLLEYGMKYENSRNRVTRTMAKGVLAALQLQADLYEKYLEQKIPLSPEFGDDQEMLSRILEGKIESAGRKRPGASRKSGRV